jgi:cytidylate kinase
MEADLTATLTLAGSIYPLQCIKETASRFAHLCAVRIVNASQRAITIEIMAENREVPFEVLVASVLNYLLDASVESGLDLA